jgi:predicted 3-demethylubiquinone-9 3-methyltransferase (glyoxalase superfamily)
MALNGRPDFDFNESFSLVITCESQEEIDHYWSALSEGGSESMCGWLKDRFGVSWQVVPSILADLMSDHAKAQKVTPVLLQMRKLVIKDLIEA